MKNMNHIDNPLKLTWNREYKVNKSNIDGGEFIDKEIGVAAMCACHNALLKIKQLNNPSLAGIEIELQETIDLIVGREKSNDTE